MKLIFLALACSPLWAGPTTTEEKAIEKLKAIAKEIRSRAYEADETVARAKEESKDILSKAEAEAAKIRAEAAEYVKKVEAEIEEIKKKMASGKEDPPGAPTRTELTESLQLAVEPLISCWAETKAKREKCALEKLRTALSKHF